MSTDLMTLWRAVRNAGGRDAYVRAQLEEKGFLVRRRETDRMSKRELANYKKELKAEAAERDRLAKEAWLAYKAAHVVHLGEGVYWNDAADFDRFDHPRAEERVAELGLPALDDPDALAEALGMGVAELRWLTYHRDATKKLHYRRFTIPKSSGGERAIWAPMPKLKGAQRWVLREIVERLPVHGAAHGFVPGRSTATNAAMHQDAEVLVKMDIQDFFPTVSLPRVKGVFRQAGYREQVATLLALLCTESPRKVVEREGETWYLALGPRCLPQGAPTSPAITNALSMRLDRRLTGLAKKLGWRYTRYADDLSFSLPTSKKKRRREPNIGALIGGVRIIVESEGFKVNEKKTHVSRPGAQQKVTGLVINDGLGPRVPRQDRRRIRAALHALRLGKPLPEGESIERIEGWIAYIRMSQPELGERLAAELAEVRGG
ncbi:MAG: RNA-directed DNA polymerase [Alphaproteobacteria bacterium]|nr:RNA-directed DNA polymerase [Alphaproteobacteria bacterium]